MTYKQIEASREARLWITQIAVPIVTTAIAAGIAIPEVRQAVVNKCKNVSKSISKKLKKKEKKAKADLEIKEFDDNVIRWFNKETGEYGIRRINI